MSITGKDYITEIIDGVMEQREIDSKLIDEQLSDQPYGHSTPTDAEFLAWWYSFLASEPEALIDGPVEKLVDAARMLAKNGFFPPVTQGEMPGMLTIQVQPNLLGLALVDGGNEWFSRYRAAVRREQERTEAAIQQYAPQEVA